MSTPVSWSYGPWRTQQTSAEPNPYQEVPASAPQALPQTPQGPFDQGEGVGRGGKDITATAEYGPMTNKEMTNMWGGALAQKGIGLGIGAAMGSPISVSSFYGMAPKAGVTVASLMSSLFGGVRGTDQEFGLPTPTDIRDIADVQGYMASAQAARDAVVQRESIRSAFDDISGVRQPDYTPDPENPDLGWGGGEDGPSGDDGGPGPGGGMGDPGGEERGGVHKTRPGQPRWSVYGEGKASQEGETGIFVPEYMKRPGQQGNEPQVEQVMRQLLRALRR